MLDSNFAELYEVETKRLNEAVGRNKARFPEAFCFKPTGDEEESLRSQIATSNGCDLKKAIPYSPRTSNIKIRITLRPYQNHVHI